MARGNSALGDISGALLDVRNSAQRPPEQCKAFRKAFGDDGTVKIRLKKGSAGSVEEDPYQVDGLSGATITSRGVTDMLAFWLSDDAFGPYLKQFKAEQGGS